MDLCLLSSRCGFVLFCLTGEIWPLPGSYIQPSVGPGTRGPGQGLTQEEGRPLAFRKLPDTAPGRTAYGGHCGFRGGSPSCPLRTSRRLGATGAQGEADSEWGTQEAPRRPPTGREVDTEPAGGQQRAPHTAARARREEEVSGPAAPRGPRCRTSADGQPPGAPGRLTLLPRPQAPRL